MNNVVRVSFVLAFLMLNICLLVPIVEPGISREETALALLLSALIALACFVLLLAGVGAKDPSYSRASRLWTQALAWSVLVGGILVIMSSSGFKGGDEAGMLFGFVTLGFAGVSLTGLIASKARSGVRRV